MIETAPFPAVPTPAWLTGILHQAGVLPVGTVTTVETSGHDAFNSRTLHLRLSYTPDANQAAPRRLVFKRNIDQAWAREAGAEEVKFYRLAAGRNDFPAVTPRCFAAEVDPLSGDSFLLLADLSETHAPPVTRADLLSLERSVPRPADQEAVIDSLARFHACWWNNPLQLTGMFEVGFWSRDAQRFALYLERRKAAWQAVLARYPSHFSSDRIAFYQDVFDRLPAFWETRLAPRFQARQHLTLIHGDTYFSNFLCPKIPGSAPAILIDWQSPSWDLAGYDLSNLLATFWTREQRRAGEREMNLLRRYYARLTEGGVAGYAWEDLLDDYRAGLMFWVLMPLQDAADGSGIDYWRPKMDCLVAAYQDWIT